MSGSVGEGVSVSEVGGKEGGREGGSELEKDIRGRRERKGRKEEKGED